MQFVWFKKTGKTCKEFIKIIYVGFCAKHFKIILKLWRGELTKFFSNSKLQICTVCYYTRFHLHNNLKSSSLEKFQYYSMTALQNSITVLQCNFPIYGPHLNHGIMDQISLKTPNPKCRLFLQKLPVNVLGGRCLSILGPHPCTYSHREGGGGVDEPGIRLAGP